MSVASQERHVTWPLCRNFKPSPSTPGRSNFKANSDYRRKKQDTYAKLRLFTVYLSVPGWYHSFCYFLLLNVQSNFSRRLSLHYITLTRDGFISCVSAKPGDGTSKSFDVCWTVHHCDNWRINNQLDATCYFIVLLIGSTRFGHYYAHHPELATIRLVTTLVVSFLVCCRLEVRCG